MCGEAYIEDIVDVFQGFPSHLKATSARLVLRGQFSEVLTSSVSGRSRSSHACVIKCASSTVSANPASRGAIALRREYGIYTLLKASSAPTGCIKCYYMHPMAHYLVLEDYAQDLRALLNPKLKNAPTVVHAVVVAVTALHSLDIMHGDIKPHNILIKPDLHEGYIVKLCDLDAAREVGESCCASSLGTKYYLAPKVYLASTRDIEASLAIDMFSLGLVIWMIIQRTSQPALFLAAQRGAPALRKCYKEQSKLNEFLPAPAKAGFHEEYIRKVTTLLPHNRMTARNLLTDMERIYASNAPHNLFLEEKNSSKMDVMTSMLETLVQSTHDIPTLAIIVPVVSKSAFCSMRSGPLNIVRNQYRLYFLCSHTHKVARCGPKGKGYKISVTKQWVIDAAPVLMVGLMVLKMAMMAGGLPLPIPDLSPLLKDADHTRFLNAALFLVQNPPDNTGDANIELDKLGQLAVGDALTEEEIAALSLKKGSVHAYHTIQQMLNKTGVNIALTCGLRKVTEKGQTAWVLNNDTTEQEYRASVKQK